MRGDNTAWPLGVSSFGKMIVSTWTPGLQISPEFFEHFVNLKNFNREIVLDYPADWSMPPEPKQNTRGQKSVFDNIRAGLF